MNAKKAFEIVHSGHLMSNFTAAVQEHDPREIVAAFSEKQDGGKNAVAEVLETSNVHTAGRIITTLSELQQTRPPQPLYAPLARWIECTVTQQQESDKPVIEHLVSILSKLSVERYQLVRAAVFIKNTVYDSDKTESSLRVLMTLLGNVTFHELRPLHIAMCESFCAVTAKVLSTQVCKPPRKDDVRSFAMEMARTCFANHKGTANAAFWLVRTCNWVAGGLPIDIGIAENFVERTSTKVIVQLLLNGHGERSLFCGALGQRVSNLPKPSSVMYGVYGMLVDHAKSGTEIGEWRNGDMIKTMKALTRIKFRLNCTSSRCTMAQFISLATSSSSPTWFTTYACSILSGLGEKITGEPDEYQQIAHHFQWGCDVSNINTLKNSPIVYSFVRAATPRDHPVLTCLKGVGETLGIQPFTINAYSGGMVERFKAHIAGETETPLLGGVSFMLSHKTAISVLGRLQATAAFGIGQWDKFWEFHLRYIDNVKKLIADKCAAGDNYIPATGEYFTPEMIAQRCFRYILNYAMSEKQTPHTSSSVWAGLAQPPNSDEHARLVRKLAKAVREQDHIVQTSMEMLLAQAKSLYESKTMPAPVKRMVFGNLVKRPGDAHVFDPKLVYGLHRHSPVTIYPSSARQLACCVYAVHRRLTNDCGTELHSVCLPVELFDIIIGYATCFTQQH